MKFFRFCNAARAFSAAILLLFSVLANAQDSGTDPDFMSRIQFGGGFGLSIGSDYTDVMIAPGAIYNFNRYFAAGAGLQGSYVKARDFYTSYMYGGSLIGLANPIEAVQLSVELEQLRINNTYELADGGQEKDNFWNTALYLGAGFRSGNVTLGVRYNVLFREDDHVYNQAFMPFVRMYF